MRIERSGPVDSMTPRVVRFLKESLSAISLDDIQSPEQLRADFACLRGLLAIELKTLEEDGSTRINNLTDELRERDDWPVFLGSAPMKAFLKNMKDSRELERRVLDRIGRSIINHLKKANKQLKAHAASFPRRNGMGILVLVNEDHEAYDPHTVSYIIWHALRRTQGDGPLYPYVDAVIYLTERHAQIIDNRLSYATMILEGPGVAVAPWKASVAPFVVERWAKWNGAPVMASGVSPDSFSTIDHIPDSVPRHEMWRIEYRRNPYLNRLSQEQLRDRFDETMMLSSLGFLKSSPMKPSSETTTKTMETFTHIMVEMAERGIPVTEFPFDASRHAEAAKRLGLPPDVQSWLLSMETGTRETAPQPQTDSGPIESGNG